MARITLKENAIIQIEAIILIKWNDFGIIKYKLLRIKILFFIYIFISFVIALYGSTKTIYGYLKKMNFIGTMLKPTIHHFKRLEIFTVYS